MYVYSLKRMMIGRKIVQKAKPFLLAKKKVVS